MYLKKLELSGFKSFAKKTTLTFDKGVTAIVGPNGCGKSNIVDSVRWVLGEQSLKALRTKRSEDVIFAGSDKKSRAGLASVSLVLDNSRGQLPVDWQEVILKRIFFRDGQSEYLLNGSGVRLRDIVELLAKSGGVFKNYSVINQGMVDTILKLTPAQRRDFFEEAAGVKIYQLKKLASLRRLKTAETNLEKVSVLIKEISPRLRSLKIRAGRVKKKKAFEAKLRGLQKNWFGRLFKELTSQKEALIVKVKELGLKIKKLEVEQESIRSKFRQEGTVGARRQRQALVEEQEKIQNQRNRLQKELALTEGRLQAAIEQETSQLEQRVSVDPVYTTGKLKEVLTGLKNCLEFSSLEKVKKGLKKILAKIENLLTEIKEGRILKQEKLFPQEKVNISQLENKKKELEAKLEEAEKALKVFKEKREQREVLEERERQSFYSKQQEVQTKQRVLEELRDKRRAVDVELAGLESRLEILTGDIKRELGPDFNVEDLAATSEVKYSLEEEIEKLKEKLVRIGEIDPLVIREYEEVNKRSEFLTNQSQDLEKAIKKLESVIKELEIKINTQFREAFQNINREFAKYFRIMFGGGKAALKIEKGQSADLETDEVSEVPLNHADLYAEQRGNVSGGGGIEIRAVPPGKRVSSLEVLSGGERALISIALLFAIISTNPPPFLVLDEVDAALDEANSRRFSKILKRQAGDTQFIVITHNRETMRQANTLYGVTMEKDGASRLLSVKLEEEKNI